MKSPIYSVNQKFYMPPFQIYFFGLGDVGGQMGLFIGCSTLTLLEAFDYFYDIIKVKNFLKN